MQARVKVNSFTLHAGVSMPEGYLNIEVEVYARVQRTGYTVQKTPLRAQCSAQLQCQSLPCLYNIHATQPAAEYHDHLSHSHSSLASEMDENHTTGLPSHLEHTIEALAPGKSGGDQGNLACGTSLIPSLREVEELTL